MALIGRQFKVFGQLAGDGGKGVPVEATKRSQPMAPAAQVNDFIEPKLLFVLPCPQRSGRLMTIAGGFVNGCFGLT